MAPVSSPALRFSQAANQFQTTPPRFARRDGSEADRRLEKLGQTIHDMIKAATGDPQLYFAANQKGRRINRLA